MGRSIESGTRIRSEKTLNFLYHQSADKAALSILPEDETLWSGLSVAGERESE